jgi:nicotinamide-nucleotide amidase
MIAEILSTGAELVLGQIADTNSAWLSARLAEIGVPVRRHTTVGDDLADIVGALREACARSDVVLMTGGLGPTEDDLTRPALAELTGRPLVLNPASLEQIKARFAKMGRPMPPENAVQAMHPEGAEPIENHWGTAPGIHAAVIADPKNALPGEPVRKVHLFVMPGVPREMTAMYDASVLPALRGLAPAGRVILTRALNCFGLGESQIGLKIKHLMARGRNPSVGTNVHEGVIRVKVTSQGDDRERAAAALEAAAAEVRSLLGDIVFGEDADTLETAVGRLLAASKQTVATAESCTGGLLGALLTNVPGISAHYLEGIVSYGNAAKMRLLGVPEETLRAHGAVSEPTAQAMAVGCRERSGADLAVSITGIAGPGGGSAEKPVGLVYLGLATSAGCTVHRRQFVGDRDQVRDRAAKTALDLLRLRLLRP